MHKADLKHSHEALQEKLENIFALRRTRSKVNWDRGQYLDLLSAFGNPQHSLPPVIHVAGTNGKGSIVAILRSILEAQGLRVHSYTSPHLIHVNERIYLAGQQIDDTYLEELIDQALSYNKGAPLSFFEMTTALAFKAFSQMPADVLLLEVGLGGRLDCTNVIDDPLVTIINRISLDHMDFLGDDIRDIAHEKAGIMKENVPCIVGHQGNGTDSHAVLKVLQDAADSSGTCLCVHGVDWHVKRCTHHITLSVGGKVFEYPLPTLQGAHQILNASVALMALHAIRDHIPVSQEAIEKGLQSVRWPGRLQNIASECFNLSEQAEIWLDSGHNDSAGEALAAQIIEWQAQEEKPTHLVIGMLNTKSSAQFLKPLLPVISALHVVSIASDPDSQDKSDIEKGINQNNYELHIHEHDNFFEALKYIGRQSSSCRVLIAGSVYLAGEVLKHVHSFD